MADIWKPELITQPKRVLKRWVAQRARSTGRARLRVPVEGAAWVRWSADVFLTLSGSLRDTLWLEMERAQTIVVANKRYNDALYFDASRNGGDLVSIVDGLTAYRIDQLAARNNRPDRLLAGLGGAAGSGFDVARAWRGSGTKVELPGIEPGSPDASAGLLRA